MSERSERTDGHSKEQRTIFGEVPDTYDRARPGYPAAMVDDIVALTELPADGRILEVGSGTGKATVLLAATGREVLCVEPSEPMVEVARRRLTDAANVRVETIGFEDWDPGARRFQLLACAQAWHWIDPAVRFVKAAQVLAPDGWLALIWNRSEDGTGSLRQAMDEAYEVHAPKLVAVPSQQASTIDRATADIEGSGLFGPVTLREYPASVTLPTERYIELLTTHSNLRLLPPEQRERLLAAVAEAHGGSIAIECSTRLFLARVI